MPPEACGGADGVDAASFGGVAAGGDSGATLGACAGGAAAAGGACELLSFCASAGALHAASNASDDTDKSVLRLERADRGPNMTNS